MWFSSLDLNWHKKMYVNCLHSKKRDKWWSMFRFGLKITFARDFTSLETKFINKFRKKLKLKLETTKRTKNIILL